MEKISESEIQNIEDTIHALLEEESQPSIESVSNILVATTLYNGLSLEVFEHTCERMIENFKFLKR